MGAWYTGLAIIGYKIPLDPFMEQYVVLSCSHAKTAGAVHCPICGVKVAVHTRSRWIKEYETLRVILNTLPDGYVSDMDTEETNLLFIGYGVSMDRDRNISFAKLNELEDFAIVKTAISNILAPVTAFLSLDDEQFGIWGTYIPH